MALAREVIVRSVSTPDLLWLSKTAPRDIAPLRNLSLLLSTAIPAETTILIDDDIYGFNLVATHHRISKLAQTSRGVIAGAEISGINEEDTITRLMGALDLLEKLPPKAKVEPIRDFFHMPDSSTSDVCTVERYVSAGYLAFQLPPERVFAFPPGYNEDWLWCLLHGGDETVRIWRSGEVVIHGPPALRRSTREDFIFELAGDLVFDCLEERYGENACDPEAALIGISGRLPSSALTPFARALELMEKVRILSQHGHSLCVLEEYGLAVLADMLRLGELDMDGSQMLTGWCRNAIAKQRSVAAMLRDEKALPVLQSLTREGRV
jgi:hypothetical protein